MKMHFSGRSLVGVVIVVLAVVAAWAEESDPVVPGFDPAGRPVFTHEGTVAGRVLDLSKVDAAALNGAAFWARHGAALEKGSVVLRAEEVNAAVEVLAKLAGREPVALPGWSGPVGNPANMVVGAIEAADVREALRRPDQGRVFAENANIGVGLGVEMAMTRSGRIQLNARTTVVAFQGFVDVGGRVASEEGANRPVILTSVAEGAGRLGARDALVFLTRTATRSVLDQPGVPVLVEEVSGARMLVVVTATAKPLIKHHVEVSGRVVRLTHLADDVRRSATFFAENEAALVAGRPVVIARGRWEAAVEQWSEVLKDRKRIGRLATSVPAVPVSSGEPAHVKVEVPGDPLPEGILITPMGDPVAAKLELMVHPRVAGKGGVALTTVARFEMFVGFEEAKTQAASSGAVVPDGFQTPVFAKQSVAGSAVLKPEQVLVMLAQIRLAPTADTPLLGPEKEVFLVAVGATAALR